MNNPLASLPGFMLRRASQVMMAELTGRLADTGLRISEASVLMLIGGGKRVTASEIGRALDIQRANMVPLLSRMEARGLIARTPIDRKSLAVVLTAAGKEMLEQVWTIVTGFELDLMERIAPEHRDHFAPALARLM